MPAIASCTRSSLTLMLTCAFLAACSERHEPVRLIGGERLSQYEAEQQRRKLDGGRAVTLDGVVDAWKSYGSPVPPMPEFMQHADVVEVQRVPNEAQELTVIPARMRPVYMPDKSSRSLAGRPGDSVGPRAGDVAKR